MSHYIGHYQFITSHYFRKKYFTHYMNVDTPKWFMCTQPQNNYY